MRHPTTLPFGSPQVAKKAAAISPLITLAILWAILPIACAAASESWPSVAPVSVHERVAGDDNPIVIPISIDAGLNPDVDQILPIPDIGALYHMRNCARHADRAGFTAPHLYLSAGWIVHFSDSRPPQSATMGLPELRWNGLWLAEAWPSYRLSGSPTQTGNARARGVLYCGRDKDGAEIYDPIAYDISVTGPFRPVGPIGKPNPVSPFAPF